MSKNKEPNCRLGVVGGQAVLEGVMMKHGDDYSIAVRKMDGTIVVEDAKYVSLRQRFKPFNLPFIRGIVNMIESLVLSTKILNRSAILAGIDEEEEKKDGKKTNWEFIFGIVTVLSLILGLALSFGLFVFLPQFLTKCLEKLIGTDLGVWKNVIEGFVKILIFIGYLSLVLLMKDIRTTFRYHGAEHKTIFCYEEGLPLTVENVRKQPMHHPRCGTSFLFVVIFVSILFSSVVFGIWPITNALLRTAIHLLLLPLVVGVTYEFNRWVGRHVQEGGIAKLLTAPGMWMQNFTTNEPDDGMIEVAIRAVEAVLPEKEGADQW